MNRKVFYWDFFFVNPEGETDLMMINLLRATSELPIDNPNLLSQVLAISMPQVLNAQSV